MAIIKYLSYKKFRIISAEKSILMWGAGKLGIYYAQSMCEGLDILGFVDDDEKKWGDSIYVNNISYPIMGKTKAEEILKEDKDLLNSIIIFVSPTAYAKEIVDEINNMKIFDNTECFLGILIRDYYEPQIFEFTEGRQKIPKKIHYCWFGGNEIPEHLRLYMDSWKKYAPEYEIIRWDESNYDVKKNRYMREAYESKAWGFVPDYARLDIIYNEGGIYLDTDVELLASPNPLLNDDMFCGFQGNFVINLGCGFGAVKGHPLIKEMRDYYDDQVFIMPNGNYNTKTCYEYQHPIFLKKGFSLEDSYQKSNGLVIYPSEVLAPSRGMISKCYTEKTISIHHQEFSWASEAEKKAWDDFCISLKTKIYYTY